MSIYEFSVPMYKQLLAAQSALIDKAIAYCEQNKIDQNALLQERLTADMRPLQFQFQQAVQHSAGAIAKMTGSTPPAWDGDTLPRLKQQIADAMAMLDKVSPSDLEGKESAEIVFETPRGGMKFVGSDFLTSFSIPNFMFHATTAYDILRKHGVEIGKRDFLGQVRRTAV